jgi:hypothetical protein
MAKQQRLSRFCAGIVSAILFLEASYFAWTSYRVAKLFSESGSTSGAGLAPGSLSGIVTAISLFAIGLLYWLDVWPIRQAAFLLGVPIAVYGAWLFWSAVPHVLSWTGAFEGDVVVLGALSSLGFLIVALFSIYLGWRRRLELV